MTIGEVDSKVEPKVDQTRNDFDEFANLNNRNTERAFTEAMQDPDGVVSVEAVAAYLILIEDGHKKKQEMLLEKIVALSGELNGRVEKLYEIQEKLETFLTGQSSAVAELLELANSLEKTADNV